MCQQIMQNGASEGPGRREEDLSQPLMFMGGWHNQIVVDSWRAKLAMCTDRPSQ